VDKYDGVPPYRETISYILRIGSAMNAAAKAATADSEQQR